MNNNILIKGEQISKKYCKSLRKSMLYGIEDIGRNILGLKARSNVLKRDEFWALSDVSFDLRYGETLGIVGPNGSGKTTLLKLLNGIFWPDIGRITLRGRIGALIEVGAGFHPYLTGKENIYINGAILGMTKREVDSRIDSIIEFADIGEFIEVPVKYYSSGMFVRLGFSIAIHCDPDILLIDEILAVGDISFQNKCLNKISNIVEEGTKSIIFVSHDMNAINLLCDRCLLINEGKLILDAKPREVIDKLSTIFIEEKDKTLPDLLKMYFIDSQENEVLDLHCGLSYSLVIKLTNFIIEKGLFIAFSFINYENKFNYRLETDKFRTLKGEMANKQIVVKFKELNIPRGYYTIRLAISDGSYINRKYQFDETIYFKVKDNPDKSNFLHTEWELTDCFS
jgi:ABC-type polysaccharide/polyol phosphate transport system ATPase subunit